MPEKSKFHSRHRARELALQTLYACEAGSLAEWENMLLRIGGEGAFAEENILYARRLVSQTMAALVTIDECIARHAANWELKRMAALDRNILRLGAAELFYFSDVPFRVVIDEAVELAKTYGAEGSGSFVNGILDSIHKARANDTERKSA